MCWPHVVTISQCRLNETQFASLTRTCTLMRASQFMSRRCINPARQIRSQAATPVCTWATGHARALTWPLLGLLCRCTGQPPHAPMHPGGGPPAAGAQRCADQLLAVFPSQPVLASACVKHPLRDTYVGASGGFNDRTSSLCKREKRGKHDSFSDIPNFVPTSLWVLLDANRLVCTPGSP